MQAKKEALDKEVEDLKIGKQMVEQENEALLCKLADLTEMNAQLLARNEALNAQIGGSKSTQNGPAFVWKIIIVVVGLLILILYVISVFVSSGRYSTKSRPLYLP